MMHFCVVITFSKALRHPFKPVFLGVLLGLLLNLKTYKCVFTQGSELSHCTCLMQAHGWLVQDFMLSVSQDREPRFPAPTTAGCHC